jgi:hypothetical protein
VVAAAAPWNNGVGARSPPWRRPSWRCRRASGVVSSWIGRSGEAWCSKGGLHGEGEGRLWELLSLDPVFAMVGLLLALPWGCWGRRGVELVTAAGCSRRLYRSFLLLRFPGVSLIWRGSAVVGRRLLLWSRLEVATTRLRRLGDVSPPMVYQRLRFRRSRWMTTAVFQRSLAAIELRSALGVWWTRLLLLRPSSGGAADLQRRVAWWPGVRTFKDHFVFFLSARVLSALSPGQPAFGLLLACGCVCGLCSCI